MKQRIKKKVINNLSYSDCILLALHTKPINWHKQVSLVAQNRKLIKRLQLKLER